MWQRSSLTYLYSKPMLYLLPSHIVSSPFIETKSLKNKAIMKEEHKLYEAISVIKRESKQKANGKEKIKQIQCRFSPAPHALTF